MSESARVESPGLVESFVRQVTRSSLFGGIKNVRFVRALYDAFLLATKPNGVKWTVNGLDVLAFDPRLRMISANHEPLEWNTVMNAIRPGDVCVDVGANVGLYALSMAKRVGEKGKVVCFEPDLKSRLLLEKHVRLNGFGERIKVDSAVVGEAEGVVEFAGDQGPFSHATRAKEPSKNAQAMTTLDIALNGERVDILKIDTEGFEEMVFQGATELFSSKERQPRLVYLEIHRQFWPNLGLKTRWEDLRSQLELWGYDVKTPDGQTVTGNDPNWFAFSTFRT